MFFIEYVFFHQFLFYSCYWVRRFCAFLIIMIKGKQTLNFIFPYLIVIRLFDGHWVFLTTQIKKFLTHFVQCYFFFGFITWWWYLHKRKYAINWRLFLFDLKLLLLHIGTLFMLNLPLNFPHESFAKFPTLVNILNIYRCHWDVRKHYIVLCSHTQGHYSFHRTVLSLLNWKLSSEIVQRVKMPNFNHFGYLLMAILFKYNCSASRNFFMW